MAKSKAKTAQIDKELVKRMALYADALLRNGAHDQEVHAKLVEQGLAPASATTVIRTLRQANLEKLRKRSQRDLKIGAGLLAVGLIVSLLLMTGVIVENSGYALLVTWALMIIAGVLVGRGLMDRRTITKSQRKAE
ncbi:MAG: hypothetical protein KF726_07795 [Anaerolineae bacterium]|nr:hypothetical protein [Anaerolineae bacterium]